MIIVRSEDAFHKAYLLRLLTEIIDNPILSHNLYFKGGTCASMLGYLDRFSIDLDFDLKNPQKADAIRKELNLIFQKLELTKAYENKKTLEFMLKYKAPAGKRNTIKLSILSAVYKNNVYRSQYLAEINRFASCQTIETMFAHKLVAVTDRFKRYKTIAGRDLYDIHYFFMQGYHFRREIIEERTGKNILDYLHELIIFIKNKVTQTIIDEDLNTLLPLDKFRKIRKIIIPETVMLLENELTSIA